MANDDEILKRFREAMIAEPAAPKQTFSREDLIERAQEAFKSFFDFVEELNRTVSETAGGEASVVLDFGDFNERNGILDAFLIVKPSRSNQTNSTLMVRFQGSRMFFEHPTLWRQNGSHAYDATASDIEEAKNKLVLYVASALRKAG
jgi:hypothetical protein